jgi:hypothetical protein
MKMERTAMGVQTAYPMIAGAATGAAAAAAAE